MWLYLSRVWVEFEPESTLNKGLRNADPIERRKCKIMSIVVTNCPVELSTDLHLPQVMYLRSDTIRKIGKFFPESSGRSRLTVGMGKHGMRSPRFAFIDECLKDLIQLWENDML